MPAGRTQRHAQRRRYLWGRERERNHGAGSSDNAPARWPRGAAPRGLQCGPRYRGSAAPSRNAEASARTVATASRHLRHRPCQRCRANGCSGDLAFLLDSLPFILFYALMVCSG